MKTLIIYQSVHHQNTLKIARVMAEVLKARLAKPGQIETKSLKEYNLIGFGSGIYFQKHHQDLFDLIEKLPFSKNKNAFIFSTSGLRKIKLINDFNRPLEKKLLKKGFQIIGVFSCRGFDTVGPLKFIGGMYKGRPDQRDLKQAADFAANLLGHSSKKDKAGFRVNR